MVEYKIYQLKDSHKSPYGFMPFDFASKHGFNLADYSQVYTDFMNSSNTNEHEEVLEELFIKFNLAHSDDFRGHSLSVSDVVELIEDSRHTFYYCDAFGWLRLDNSSKNR